MQKRHSMKKVLSLLVLSLLAISSAQAVIVFNPANPLNVVDEGGFTGTGTSAGDPYEAVRLRFNFTGLNPSPLPSSFQISNIFLKGPGITTSLSLGSITITGNGNSPFTSLVALNSTVPALNFATGGVEVSFDVPAGVINDGASFSTAVTYATFDLSQVSTSATGPIFQAQNAAPIPEPGTWAAAALLAGGAAFARWRKRKSA